MQRTHRLPRPAHLQQHQSFGRENPRVPPSLSKYLIELIKRERPVSLSTVCVAEIRPCSNPGTRVAVDFFGNGEGFAEELDGMREMVKVVKHDGEFVEEQGVGLAELVRGVEVFLRECHVVELEVLHAEK